MIESQFDFYSNFKIFDCGNIQNGEYTLNCEIKNKTAQLNIIFIITM